MHVDGFRFDLASALARQFYDVDRLSTFFDTIHQDPTLSQVKLVAEPWDVGPGGYQVGNFPVRWAEWNGRYRDTLRDYWRDRAGGVSDLAYRLTGSSDLYEADGRRPSASINFVTAHDGFTLSDLVSYDNKHNEQNGEKNQDGTDDNRSWNCGAEGPTEDGFVNDLRARQQRNFLATLLLSQGCPMLLSGDEIGRTQQGNNNAYCQDNEVSWLDWEKADQPLYDFAQRIIQLRKAQPVLRRRRFFSGAVGRGHARKDVAWFRQDGQEMRDGNWRSRTQSSLGMLLNGDLIPERSERGERITGDTLLVYMHAGSEPIIWTLPGQAWGAQWEILLDTAAPTEDAGVRRLASGAHLEAAPRSLVVLRRMPSSTEPQS
jgi:glycogen operon protein